MRKVGDDVKRFLRFGIELAHDCTHRHLQNQIFTAFSVSTRPLTMRAALCTEMMLEAVVDQRRQLRRSLDHYVTAAAAVAAVRTAFRHVGLASKGHAASAAVAALNVDTADIGKLRHRMPFS